jgi:hypothetical protein
MGDSVVSALSSGSTSSSVHDGQVAFAQLARSPKKHRVRKRIKSEDRRNRSDKELSRSRCFQTTSFSSDSTNRSDEIVKKLISAISFSTNGEDDVAKEISEDDHSVISSLGMGFLGETDDELELEDEQGHDDDRSCQDDSIVRIQRQIKMLQRSSMERFQATPTKSPSLNSDSTKPPSAPSKTVDSIPSLPLSCSEREKFPSEDLLWSQDIVVPLTGNTLKPNAFAVEERSNQRFLPFLTAASSDLVETNQEMRMSQSLPKDLPYLTRRCHCVPSIPCRHDTDVEDNDTTDDVTGCTSIGGGSSAVIRRTDRWGSGGSNSMERDRALVRESFERASSLRREKSLHLSCHGSCHSGIDGSIHKARQPTASRSVAKDTILMPPRRRAKY